MIPTQSAPIRLIQKRRKKCPKALEATEGRIRELELQAMGLKITNRGKALFIEQLGQERPANYVSAGLLLPDSRWRCQWMAKRDNSSMVLRFNFFLMFSRWEATVFTLR